jgi:ABC-2 type transport system ATP-binding protein
VNPIAVNRLVKTYGKVRAVEGFSLVTHEGELVALAGPDGAGKTSLFRSICGLIRFDDGDIRVAGYDVRTDFERIKPLLGYMPQTFSLYPDLSVDENLRFYAGIFGMGRAEFDRRKKQLYEFSGLGPFSGRRAEHLSGGMKQKLALSCDLIHNPKILVLDEPTTGVDPLSRRQFWDILKELRGQGASIVVSTPYMDELGLSDRAVLMNRGRKLAEGRPGELLSAYRGRVFSVPRLLTTEEMEKLTALEAINARRYGAALRIYTGKGMGPDDVGRAISSVGIAADGVSEIEPEMEDVFVQFMQGAAGQSEAASPGAAQPGDTSDEHGND